jgi:LAO/AO transport system kinase
MALLESVLNGDRRAIARAISLVESQDSEACTLLDALYRHTGHAHRIGVTGFPGTGKSTLINQVARAYRERGRRVGVIAIDPSSSLTGGALLGDRVRMTDLSGDADVFIRSMATRGAVGGLALTTIEAAHILDAAGYDPILIETVGAGQDEIDISLAAHTVIVVDAPGLGDDIQAIKAGLAEIAHIYVVNKADRQGADRAALAAEAMIAQRGCGVADNPTPENTKWHLQVCKTVALDGTGVQELVALVQAHRQHLEKSAEGRAQKLLRARAQIKIALSRALLQSFVDALEPGQLDRVIEQLASHQLTPLGALRKLGISRGE